MQFSQVRTPLHTPVHPGTSPGCIITARITLACSSSSARRMASRVMPPLVVLPSRLRRRGAGNWAKGALVVPPGAEVGLRTTHADEEHTAARCFSSTTPAASHPPTFASIHRSGSLWHSLERLHAAASAAALLGGQAAQLHRDAHPLHSLRGLRGVGLGGRWVRGRPGDWGG